MALRLSFHINVLLQNSVPLSSRQDMPALVWVRPFAGIPLFWKVGARQAEAQLGGPEAITQNPALPWAFGGVRRKRQAGP